MSRQWYLEDDAIDRRVSVRGSYRCFECSLSCLGRQLQVLEGHAGTLARPANRANIRIDCRIAGNINRHQPWWTARRAEKCSRLGCDLGLEGFDDGAAV